MLSQQMQHGFDMQQQHANIEWSQADNLRLQRLNQDSAGWDTLHSSGEIDDQEYAQGRQMIAQQQMPMQARRQAAEQAKLTTETRRAASMAAHQDSLDALQREQRARTGNVGHYRVPDPNDPSGQTMLPGMYQRNRYGETELITGTDGAGGRGRSGGAGASGGIAPQIDSAIQHATATVDRALSSSPETGGLPANHPWRTDRGAAILNEARAHRQAAEALTAEDRDVRSQNAGGPLPFDVPDNSPASSVPGVVQNQLQNNINRAVQAAEARNAPRQSEALRRVAAAIQGGQSTGDLSPEQQQILQTTGYYRQEFTPQIDRQISAAITPPPQIVSNGGQRVVERRNPSPQMQAAAQDFRSLLAAFGSRPPESSPMARQRFDELRGQIGFTSWPPPLSRHSDRPAIPVSAPRPPNLMQQLGTPNQANAGNGGMQQAPWE